VGVIALDAGQELVALAPAGGDPSVAALAGELLAQAARVAVESPSALWRGVAPDRAHQLVLGEDLGRVAGELAQQVELLAAELDAAALDVDAPGGGVDVQLADVQVAAGDAAQRALGDLRR
jgi:hypothetical protein